MRSDSREPRTAVGACNDCKATPVPGRLLAGFQVGKRWSIRFPKKVSSAPEKFTAAVAARMRHHDQMQVIIGYVGGLPDGVAEVVLGCSSTHGTRAIRSSSLSKYKNVVGRKSSFNRCRLVEIPRRKWATDGHGFVRKTRGGIGA